MNITANELNKINLPAASVWFLVYFFVIIVLLGSGREVFAEKIRAV